MRCPGVRHDQLFVARAMGRAQLLRDHGNRRHAHCHSSQDFGPSRRAGRYRRISSQRSTSVWFAAAPSPATIGPAVAAHAHGRFRSDGPAVTGPGRIPSATVPDDVLHEVIGVSRNVQSVRYMQDDGPFYYGLLDPVQAKPQTMLIRVSGDPRGNHARRCEDRSSAGSADGGQRRPRWPPSSRRRASVLRPIAIYGSLAGRAGAAAGADRRLRRGLVLGEPAGARAGDPRRARRSAARRRLAGAALGGRADRRRAARWNRPDAGGRRAGCRRCSTA